MSRNSFPSKGDKLRVRGWINWSYHELYDSALPCARVMKRPLEESSEAPGMSCDFVKTFIISQNTINMLNQWSLFSVMSQYVGFIGLGTKEPRMFLFAVTSNIHLGNLCLLSSLFWTQQVWDQILQSRESSAESSPDAF